MGMAVCVPLSDMARQARNGEREIRRIRFDRMASSDRAHEKQCARDRVTLCAITGRARFSGTGASIHASFGPAFHRNRCFRALLFPRRESNF